MPQGETPGSVFLQSARRIPLWPVDSDGRCSCGGACRRPGKHPASNAPGPGYVLETGAETGLLVIDVDTKGGVDGYAQLEELEEQLGDLPETLEVRTGSGGLHLYFRHPGGVRLNGKLATAIDLKGDKATDEGLVYVVGPGSPGYLKTPDPGVVRPSSQGYAIDKDHPIADLPEVWLAYLKSMSSSRSDSFRPIPVDVDTEEGRRRVSLGIEAAKTAAPSRADGEAGRNLFALAIRLVRRLELPVPAALDIVREHFNPRCTDPQGRPFPWADEDILHKLEDARDKSEAPCGTLSQVTVDGYKELAERRATMSTPPALRALLPSNDIKRKLPDPAHVYTLEAGCMSSHPESKKFPFNTLISILSSGEDWAGCWQFDEFADAVRCVNPPIKLDAEERGVTAEDISTVRSWLDHTGVLANDKDISGAINQAARRLRYHPVREYLSALPKGDASIFDGLAARLFGTDEPLADKFLEKTLVAAVRRVLTPGCQVDTVLVLVGESQGEGKTTFVCELFGHDWTRRGLPVSKGLADRDAAHALVGFWCIELGELVSLTKSSTEEAKDYLTKSEDTYREFGTGGRVRRKRECIFIGTTNDAAFLRDSRNRRYWPIQIPLGHNIPRDWVREHRDALWAAARDLALDEGYLHWFDRADEEILERSRAAHLELDGWFDTVRDYCAGETFVRAEDVFISAIGGSRAAFDNKAKRRIEDCFRKLGMRYGKERGQRRREGPDARRRGWIVPDALAAEPKAPRPRVVPLQPMGK